MTEENFIKFVGLKLVFCLISPNLSAEKWWNKVKDQIQTCKFGKIFFSHFKLVFYSNDMWRQLKDSEHCKTLFHGSELAGACILKHNI